MNKILLITQREFLSRVRKRSFLIMSILAPLIFGGFITSMAYFSTRGDNEVKTIAVLDSTTAFFNKIPNTKSLKFVYLSNTNLVEMKKNLKKSKYYGILYIEPIILVNGSGSYFFSYSQPGISIVEHITKSMEKVIRDINLHSLNIDNIDQLLKKAEKNVSLQTYKLNENNEEKESSTAMTMGIAYVASLLIYMFILLYGVQVMRGVIEEKTNRIVEVIISSVKPFQLMMGKVLGIALTALTQFLIWVLLSTGVFIVAKQVFLPNANIPAMQTPAQSIMDSQQKITQVESPMPKMDRNSIEIFTKLESINYFKIIGLFLFYFITGYLLYSSLFAAIGSAVDNESDPQQFMFPVTVPLIAAIMIMVQTLQYPDSPVAVWGSIIPLTAPIVMMARLPFEVPIGELILSMSLMVLSFLGAIWMAAKIYRTGILMYGKKVTLKEMIKWLRYKG